MKSWIAKRMNIDWRSKKFWLTVGSFFVLVIGLAAVLTLAEQRQLFQKRAVGENASLSLLSSLSAAVNQEFNVPIMLNTDGATIVGTDVVLNFDKTRLQLITITPQPQNSTLKTFVPVDTNGVFKATDIVTNANLSGKIEFGAVTFDWGASSVLGGFNGVLGPTNPLAILRFKALQTGQTTVSFDFTLGSTTDSNLVKAVDIVDLLAKVTNLTLNVSSSGTTTPPASPTPTIITTPTPIPTLEPTPTQQPQTGNLTATLKLEGVVNPPAVLELAAKLTKDSQQTNRVVQATPTTGNNYRTTFYNLQPGSYEFVVKPPKHLSGKFTSVVINEGNNTKDWTTKTLWAGDVSGISGQPNNLIDIFDFTLMVQEYDKLNSPADADYDGKVTVFDITYVVANFDKKGDE